MNEVIVSNENAKIKIKIWHLFLFNFIFLLLCYFPNLQMRFSVDSYLRTIDYNSNFNFQIKDSRFLSYIVTKIQFVFKLHPVLNQQFYFFIYISLLSLCILFLIKIYASVAQIKNVYELAVLNFIFLFSTANILIQEFSCFPETYLYYGLGLLLSVLSVYCFFHFESNSIKKFIWSWLFLFCSLEFYQIFITVWCVLLAVFLFVKYDKKLCKNFWKDTFLGLLIFFSSALCTIIVLKFMQFIKIAASGRGFTFSKIIPNINIIAHKIIDFLFHPINSVVGIALYIIIIIFLLHMILLTIKLFVNKVDLYNYIFPFLFLLLGFAIIFGFHVFMSDIWLVPRVLIGLGFLISSVLLFFYLDLNQRVINKFLLFVFILFIINIYFVQSISINQYANNRLDQEQIYNICYRICEYEKENKIEVKNISVCKDKSPTWGYYKNIKFIFGDTNIRELMVDWGQKEIINYYSGRNFKKIDMPKEIYEKYFADKNWDYYKPEEQLIFLGDTLYICVY